MLETYDLFLMNDGHTFQVFSKLMTTKSRSNPNIYEVVKAMSSLFSRKKCLKPISQLRVFIFQVGCMANPLPGTFLPLPPENGRGIPRSSLIPTLLDQVLCIQLIPNQFCNSDQRSTSLHFICFDIPSFFGSHQVQIVTIFS